MTDAELDALTEGLDREFIVDESQEMSPADRRRWERARRKRGRPRVGRGAEVVSVSIERGLLARSDRLAKRLGTSRARLVAVGLERVLASLERTVKRGPARKSRVIAPGRQRRPSGPGRSR